MWSSHVFQLNCFSLSLPSAVTAASGSSVGAVRISSCLLRVMATSVPRTYRVNCSVFHDEGCLEGAYCKNKACNLVAWLPNYRRVP